MNNRLPFPGLIVWEEVPNQLSRFLLCQHHRKLIVARDIFCIIVNQPSHIIRDFLSRHPGKMNGHLFTPNRFPLV